MANETGIYKLKDGGWGFRYTISVCGKRKDVKRVRDAYGNPMKTKRDAVLARAEAMKAEEIPQQIRIVRKSVKEVYTLLNSLTITDTIGTHKILFHINSLLFHYI